ETGGVAAELLPVAERGETGVNGAEVLDPLQHALAGLEQARLEVHHAVTGPLGQRLQLVGPHRDAAHLRLVEEAGNHHEAVPPERLERLGRLDRLAHRVDPPVANIYALARLPGSKSDDRTI